MPSPGDKIAHYKVISALGKGGMGEVYLAEDARLERQVALKILTGDVAADDDRIRRFIQEAKAASALNHPNILTVYEIGEYENSRYIATELIRGETLRQRLGRDPIGLSEAISVALQVAASLAAAHEAGILHRDIKPENIMIRKDGLVKVLDFGLAKLTEKSVKAIAPEDPTLYKRFDTQPGMIVGTIAYMSPEQVRGRKLDARSDIFSVGIMMYELFTGKFPFAGEGHLELAGSILKDEPQPIRQLSPGLPRQLERIVDKTLRKDRENRYQHVKDLQIDLEDLRDELKFEAKQTQTADQQLPANTTQKLTLSESISTKRRFTLLHALLFAAAAVVLVGAAWYFRSGSVQARVPGTYKTAEVAAWNSAAGEIFHRAAFSPDGKMIAFASTKSGTKNIWVTQTGSTEARQVTNDTLANMDPIWSPRGDEIAYFSINGRVSADSTAGWGIWRIPWLGGTPKLISTVSDGSARLRRWTQSGKIYYQLRGELYTVDVTTGATQKATSLDQEHLLWLNVSPDEKSVATVVQDDNAWRITVRSITGDSPIEVAKGTGHADGFAWLPEKKRFFYSATVDGVLQVFAADIDSGEPVRITASETDSSVADAAPDGRSIVVTSAKEESDLWRAGVAGDQESPVIRDLNAKLWPAVSPDDRKVAFQSVRNLSQGNKLYETAIMVADMRPGDAVRPTQLAESGFLPSWSPDGTTLAYLKLYGAETGLVTLDSSGGSEIRATRGSLSAAGYSVSPYDYMQSRAFAFSPDSSKIAYVSERDGVQNIWTVGRRDSVETALTNNTDKQVTFSCPAWDANGKRVAFSFENTQPDEKGNTIFGLRLFDAVAGTTTIVYRTDRVMRLIDWTADQKGLIIAESDTQAVKPTETRLRRVDIAGGPGTVITHLKNAYFYNIFLSDDRKFIAFAARDQNLDNVWVMPANGGDSRKLTGNNDSGLYYSRLAWLHDGSAVVFGKQTRFSLLSLISDIDQ